MRNLPILTLAFLLCSALPCGALTHLETTELLSQADLVAVGDIISVDQGLESTRAQARLLQVIKGRGEAPGNLVTIETAGGKVYIDESQPSFMTPQANLLFLKKTADGYVCVNQADGQKLIRGRNIYPYHDNASYSVPLKDYLTALEGVVKALATQQPRSQT